jgi:hypothetical protein
MRAVAVVAAQLQKVQVVQVAAAMGVLVQQVRTMLWLVQQTLAVVVVEGVLIMVQVAQVDLV